MRKALLSILFCYSLTLPAQELDILIKEPPPYMLSQDINFEIYLTNTTDSSITYFDSRGSSWNSFKEVWSMNVNNQFLEILPLNGAYNSKFTDSAIITLQPGNKKLARTYVFNLKSTGLYSLTYIQEQSPAFVKREHADNSVSDSAINNITTFKVSKNIKFEVFKHYDTTISELITMSWEEWKDYSHVKVFSRNKHFFNIDAALRFPQDAYSLTLYCDDLNKEDIKRISRLKNLKALVLRDYKLDSFPKELTELNLYELTIIPKNEITIDFSEGISKNSTIRKLTAKFYDGIPEQILSLKKLIYLDIKDCNIKTLPKLDSLQNLEVLIANNTKISTLENASLDKLLKLKDINMSGNRKIDDITPLLNCTNLEFLVINRTNIQSIPDEIENLSKLKKLSISSKLTSITDSIGKLDDMRYLSFGGNRNLDSLPHSITNMKKLLHLDLSSTKIDQLPEGIADLPLEKVLIYNTDCTRTKDYKLLKNRLGNKFKD